jgi:hypothetical protein
VLSGKTLNLTLVPQDSSHSNSTKILVEKDRAMPTMGFGTRRFSLVMAPSVDHKVKMRSFGMGLKWVLQ